MVKSKKIICLILFCVLWISSCRPPESNSGGAAMDSDQKDIYTGENVTVENGIEIVESNVETDDTFVQDTESETEEYLNSVEERLYTLNLPVYEGGDHFIVYDPMLPEIIDDSRYYILGLVTKTQYICAKFRETGTDMFELGIWDNEHRSYSSISSVEEGFWRVACSLDKFYFIEGMKYEDGKSCPKWAGLWMLDCRTGVFEKIYDYKNNNHGQTIYVEGNQRVVYQNCLYFDDYLQEGISSALRYNIDKKTIEIIGDHMVNPMIIQGHICYFYGTENNKYDKIYDLETDTYIELNGMNKYLTASNNKETIVVYQDGEESGMNSTISAAGLLGTEQVFFRAVAVLDSLRAADRFAAVSVGWSTPFDQMVPILYDFDRHCLWKLSDAKGGTHHYALKDNYGYISTSYVASEDGEHYHFESCEYFFEYVGD